MANEQRRIQGKSRNLGQVAAIIKSATHPENTDILWYDTSVSSGCPIKYYDLTSHTWEPLKD